MNEPELFNSTVTADGSSRLLAAGRKHLDPWGQGPRLAPTVLSRQKTLILKALRDYGIIGAPMDVLNKICFRYGARIWDMNKQGFTIEAVRVGGSEFRYVLRDEPSQVKLWGEP